MRLCGVVIYGVLGLEFGNRDEVKVLKMRSIRELVHF